MLSRSQGKSEGSDPGTEPWTRTEVMGGGLRAGEQHVPEHRGRRNQCIPGTGGYRNRSVVTGRRGQNRGPCPPC